MGHSSPKGTRPVRAPESDRSIPKGSRHSGAPLQGFLVYNNTSPMALPWAANGLPRWGVDADSGSHADATPSRILNRQPPLPMPRARGNVCTACPLQRPPSRTLRGQPTLLTPRARGSVITNCRFRHASLAEMPSPSARSDAARSRRCHYRLQVLTPRMGHSSSSPWQRHGTFIPKRNTPCQGTRI
jgi:hypothetical protein